MRLYQGNIPFEASLDHPIWGIAPEHQDYTTCTDMERAMGRMLQVRDRSGRRGNLAACQSRALVRDC